MAIKNFNELYWKLFNIAGGGTEADVTKILDSIVKSDRSKLDQYFTSAVDQIAFDTQDWKRMRAFFIDLFTAHRSLITQGAGLSDPHFLSNAELDELFRSFGFPESVRLKGSDENPLESKVQLFLDLVNLYKIKGTPRSILEVLQFYGITELDIFEFWLQKSGPNTLVFKGDVIVGTTLNPSSITLPYELVTLDDPHWMMSQSQILNLDSLNKINLPSKTPYFAVQPTVEVGIENSILVRLVQDQYDGWYATGDLPPQNADITILGVASSLLELYLLTLYSFHKDYEIGSEISRFACYDGTNTSTVEIVDEYNQIIGPPITRDNKDIKYQEYLDLFTRVRSDHFLYNYNDATSNNAAELALNDINPSLIADLDSLTSDNVTVLQSLLKDLAVWVRNNVGFGFVNLGYIFFGLNQLFEDLKPVIKFFKPYRSRLIVLELLNFRNLLTESILIDDSASFDIDFETYDYMTADSAPCCDADTDATAYVCIDTTAGTYYSRDTYDCGSYHDIGAVTDFRGIEIAIEQNFCDTFRCPPGCVEDVSVPACDSNASYQDICGDLRCRESTTPYWLDGTTRIISYPILDGTTWTTLDYEESAVIADPTYCPTWDWEKASPPIWVPSPDGTGFVNAWVSTYPDRIDCVSLVDCTAVVPLTCKTIPTVFSETLIDTLAHIENLFIGTEQFTVLFSEPQNDTSYILNVNMFNEIDGSLASMYGLIITDKTTNGFTVSFSSPLDSVYYKLSWSIDTEASESGINNLTNGLDTYRVTFDVPFPNNNYTIGTSMINEIDAEPSMYHFIVTERSNDGFTMQFNSPIDSANYNVNWNVYDSTSFIPNGLVNIPEGVEVYTVDTPNQENDQYSLGLTILNTEDATTSIYSYIITQKNSNNFTVRFSSPIDSTSYYIAWVITFTTEEEFLYTQESGFRLFDTMGTFDCTHGFDMVEISVEVVPQTGVILRENEFWLLQENGGALLLE
ncbi:MAG: hypothetical protein V3W20_14025 [Candidatus Neomarinimicrobiota bacterium]